MKTKTRSLRQKLEGPSRFSDGEVIAVNNERINEIRAVTAAIQFALYGRLPGQAFIRTQHRT